MDIFLDISSLSIGLSILHQTGCLAEPSSAYHSNKMPMWHAFETIPPSLPNHCSPQSDFLAQLSSTLNICVPTHQAFLSTLLGCLSIVSWLFAQIPQIIKNARLQSTAGLSVYFLVEWCLGDAANLAGAILTSQATWQVVVASYYLSVDMVSAPNMLLSLLTSQVLVLQHYFYSHYKSRTKEKLLANPEDHDGHRTEGTFPAESINSGQTPLPDLFSPTSFNGSASRVSNQKVSIPCPGSPRSSAFSEKHTSSLSRSLRFSKPSLHTPSKILLAGSLGCALLSHASPLPSPGHLSISSSYHPFASVDLGSILSWLSTVLYLCSRLPQIYKNHRRRSTAGLSPHLFAAAFCGNLFYSSSLLSNPLAWASYPPYGAHGWAPANGSDRLRWITLAAPFWLGAAGVLFLDAVVGVQFLIFGDGEHALDVPIAVIPPGVAIDAEVLARGRTQWRNLDGWMRGWVPSPTPSIRGIFWPTAPEQRPLLQAGGPFRTRRSRTALWRLPGSRHLADGDTSAYGST